MRIIVFDIPASSGGAATILDYYYNKCVEDTANQYIFVIGKYELNDKENIHILKFPWAKITWIHRIYFDIFIANKLVKKYQPDMILSLQNTLIITSSKAPQTIYMHQSIPFTNIRFNPFLDPKYWIIQNLIGKYIIYSLKKSSQVIVQTEWIKQSCAQKAKVPLEKISLERPQIINDISRNDVYCDYKKDYKTLFYPANSNSFKNHIALIKALELFKNNTIEMPRIVFTISDKMGRNAKRIIKEAKKRNVEIDFIGRIKHEEVINYYKSSIVVFPSKLETLGLPLLEARLINCPIICSDKLFAHEVLSGYNRVIYFDPDNVREIEKAIELVLSKYE